MWNFSHLRLFNQRCRGGQRTESTDSFLEVLATQSFGTDPNQTGKFLCALNHWNKNWNTMQFYIWKFFSINFLWIFCTSNLSRQNYTLRSKFKLTPESAAKISIIFHFRQTFHNKTSLPIRYFITSIHIKNFQLHGRLLHPKRRDCAQAAENCGRWARLEDSKWVH
jgi:hypothetical protein